MNIIASIKNIILPNRTQIHREKGYYSILDSEGKTYAEITFVEDGPDEWRMQGIRAFVPRKGHATRLWRAVNKDAVRQGVKITVASECILPAGILFLAKMKCEHLLSDDDARRPMIKQYARLLEKKCKGLHIVTITGKAGLFMDQDAAEKDGVTVIKADGTKIYIYASEMKNCHVEIIK